MLNLLGGLDNFDNGLGAPVVTNKVSTAPAASNQDLLDLLGGLDLGGPIAPVSSPPISSTSLVNNNLANLLSSSTTQTSAPVPPSSNFLIDGFLGTAPTPPSNSILPSKLDFLLSNIFSILELQSVTAYEKNGLKVDFSFDRPIDNPNLMIVTLTANSSYGSTLSDFLFQAAVPKTFQLQMMPASSTVISSGSPVTQVMRILNPTKVSRLRRTLE